MKIKNNLMILAFGIMAFACTKEDDTTPTTPVVAKDPAGAPLPKCKLVSSKDVSDYSKGDITNKYNSTTEFKYNDDLSQIISYVTNGTNEYKSSTTDSYTKYSRSSNYSRDDKGRVSQGIYEHNNEETDNNSGETDEYSSKDTTLYSYTGTDYKPSKVGNSSLTYDSEGRVTKAVRLYKGTSTTKKVNGKYISVPKYTYTSTFTTKYTYGEGDFDITRKKYLKKVQEDGTVLEAEKPTDTTYYNIDDKNTALQASLFGYESYYFTHNITEIYNGNKEKTGEYTYEYNEQGFPTKKETYNGEKSLTKTSTYTYKCE